VCCLQDKNRDKDRDHDRDKERDKDRKRGRESKEKGHERDEGERDRKRIREDRQEGGEEERSNGSNNPSPGVCGYVWGWDVCGGQCWWVGGCVHMWFCVCTCMHR